MKTYNGPPPPVVFPFVEQTRVGVRDTIPSLLKNANIGSEDREDEAAELTTILADFARLKHQLAHRIHFVDLYFPKDKEKQSQQDQYCLPIT